MREQIMQSLTVLGFTYEELSAHIGVHGSMLSKWGHGVRAIPQHHYDDLLRLYIRARDLQQSGQEPRAALKYWRPLTLVSPGGGVSHTGEVDIPADLAALLITREHPFFTLLSLVSACRALAVYATADPKTLTFSADDLDQLFQSAAHLTLTLHKLAEDEAQARADAAPARSAPAKE